ncbi:hypothetical protein RBE51_21710 [Pseudomonas taiwanensis]|uniref:hypothetical protein n=1 Tax=Pseudomonas taiwanensis TaxID=470150 RepID=UPI0028DFC319|nr:hypothetical protein [Pseudomonas taiwanensis]MDT8925416.1 hypothetical protein [Pseudomonas taiwanensis]
MSQNDNVSALVKAMGLIPLAIIGFLTLMIAGVEQLKSSNTAASSTPAMNTASNRLAESAFNPITYPTAYELFEANPSPAAALPFAPDCGKQPSLCLLESVRQARTPETVLAGLSFMPGLQAELHEVDHAYVRDGIVNPQLAVCQMSKTDLHLRMYISGEQPLKGNPVAAFLQTLSTYSREIHQAPQFVSAADPVYGRLVGLLQADLRQPELRGGFDQNPPLAVFKAGRTHLWVALHKTVGGYELLLLQAPAIIAC